MNAKVLRTILSVLLALTILAACAGCAGDLPAASKTKDSGKNTSTAGQETTSAGQATTPAGQETTAAADASATRPEQFSQDEYILYQNIFYQGYGDSFKGTAVTKTGVFASIYDAFNSVTRYYVWGYYDQTRCCDWQWEFVPKEGESLPSVGSLVTVTGTFAYDESALDKYWITGAQVTVETAYAGPTAERDMCAMSCTLERVQMMNILYHSDVFEGQEFYAYGRIAAPDTLQDPYYDGSWQIGITWDGNVPAIGTLVMITGSVQDGKLIVSSMENM